MYRFSKFKINKLFYKIILLSLLLINTSKVISQSNDKSKALNFKYSISLGMGVSLTENSSFNDYLKNIVPYSSGDSIKTWTVGLEFAGGFEYRIAKKFSLKLEYTYYTKSLNYTYSYFNYNYTIVKHKPGVMVYYLITGNKYQFKIGSGFNVQFGNLESDLGSNNITNYSCGGFGYKGEVIFAPMLTNKLGAIISGFIIADKNPSLKDQNGNLLIDPISKNEVNLSSFGIGALLGFSYNF
jgi:hypothetical protein